MTTILRRNVISICHEDNVTLKSICRKDEIEVTQNKIGVTKNINISAPGHVLCTLGQDCENSRKIGNNDSLQV